MKFKYKYECIDCTEKQIECPMCCEYFGENDMRWILPHTSAWGDEKELQFVCSEVCAYEWIEEYVEGKYNNIEGVM